MRDANKSLSSDLLLTIRCLFLTSLFLYHIKSEADTSNLKINTLRNFRSMYPSIDSLERFLKKNSTKHFPAIGDATLSGVMVDCNIENGLANNIQSYIYGNLFKN